MEFLAVRVLFQWVAFQDGEELVSIAEVILIGGAVRCGAKARWKIIQVDRTVGRIDEHDFEKVAQFAYVAGPIVIHDLSQCLTGERAHALRVAMFMSERKCCSRSGISALRSRKGGKCIRATCNR